MKFRLLKTGLLPAADNMAIDEAVLALIAEGKSPPSLRLYGWSPPAISIGYFQNLEEEVDLAACNKFGVDYVRRITGGGAVLHEHEITYSIHIPESLRLMPPGILESYEKICGGVIKGLSSIGITAKFVPLNDLVAELNGGVKKISGNAQTRRRGIILQHGTVLLRVDVDKMFELLKVPSEKLKGKLIQDVKQRVTGLSEILERNFGFDEALFAMEKGFRQEFSDIDFEDGALSKNELALAQKLKKEKYMMDSWNRTTL